MRPINEIIVHCSATRPEWMDGHSVQAQAAEIDRWHRERNWKQIGYHYVVGRSGDVVEGRPIEHVGAHTKAHNTGTIGICLIGGHGGGASDAFSDNFTPAQDRALRRLIAQLRAEYPAIKKISGHNDYTNLKTCPTFRVKPWLEGKVAEAPKERQSVAQSRTVQASVVQGASAVGGAVGAINGLSGTAQIVALVCCAAVLIAGIVVFRERIKHWANGVR